MNDNIRKNVAQEQVFNVKNELKNTFPELTDLICNTPVYLLSGQNKVMSRNRIAEEIGADGRSSVIDTAAEVLVGKNNFAIIMYYTRIPKYLFKHFLLHEFGHVASIFHCKSIYDKVQKEIELDSDTELRSGASLWSELVAEAFAYRVEGNRFAPYGGYSELQAERLMDEAVNVDAFEPYPFAFYLAMFFEDPEILYYRDKYPNAAIGANHCDDEIMPIIEKTLNVVVRLLDKDDVWNVSEMELTSVGKCVNELWTYCWHKKEINIFEQISDLLNV